MTMQDTPTASLLTAVQSDDIETLDVLLNESLTKSDLNTALCWSARLGHCEITKLLLKAGAEPNIQLWGGFSPLLWATIFSENAAIIHLLISAGSDVNCASYRRRQTVLHAAVIRGHPTFTTILLTKGANPDMQDVLSRTPLHYAVQRKHLECMKLLIQRNCDVNLGGVFNGAYVSPLYLALLQNYLEGAKMLLLAGARFSQPSIYSPFTVNQFYRIVEDQLHMQVRPVYLKQQCRVCIRQQFGFDILHKLDQLLYPKRLKDFILLEELSSCTCSLSSQ